MVFRAVVCLGLAMTGRASHGDVDAVVNGTAQVIGALREKGDRARERFANVSQFDDALDEIGHVVAADFDKARYSEMAKEFTALAQRAYEKANRSSSSANATVAEELAEKADEVMRNMSKVGFALDSMEKALHDKLHDALNASLDPELRAADAFSGAASHLQAQAHSMMDPLYSWGDSAEERADRLNDQTDDALSAVDKLVRTYRRNISSRAREVQRSVERELFSDRDRTATWRNVSRLVRRASWHAHELRLSESAGMLSLQLGSLGGVVTLVSVSACAAAVGALLGYAVAFARSAPQRTNYQLLSA